MLYLSGHRETAEDLSQETFLQAWRHLDQFQGRSTLQFWLHRIARREFLRSRREQRPATSLAAVAEVAAPHCGGGWIDEAELRLLLDTLPEELREAVILHDVSGYSSAEIARIVHAPASTIRTRLSVARTRLQRELGEGDLAYLNEPFAPMRQWRWLPLDQMHALEARLARGDEASKEEAMERRQFLRHAAAGAAGLMLPDAEKEVVDGRLTQKVTLAFKGTALSDLCDHLRSETGVHVATGASVADEKVTLFCEKAALREVMRQLSRPFGYTWLRSTRNGAYHYELVQDMRSQLLEEELRNRDRHAALLALDREMERYRSYLSLSPVEAEARLKTAPEAEKPLLEKLGGPDVDAQIGLGWGPIQMYFRLSRAEQEALRAGQELLFSSKPEPGQSALPPDVARGVLQSYGNWHVNKGSDYWNFVRTNAGPEDLPVTAVPEVCGSVALRMTESELGTLTLGGGSGIFFRQGGGSRGPNGPAPYASGRSPAVVEPENERLNARFAAEPALRPLVTVQPQPSYRPVANADGAPPLEPKVTPADLLEAFHRATGLPVVGDYYTRLYPPAELSVRNMPLYPALNQLADAMRLRWTLADGNWLQFRSASYYDDRVKEVPNRLLARWSTARQQRGFLSLDDLVEIAGLPDAPLNGQEMAEAGEERFGAQRQRRGPGPGQEIWGLREWELPRNSLLRPHLRFLALFTPEQRQQAMTDEGLPFVKMTLPQQQQFLSNAAMELPLDVLAETVLRVDYSRPGEFQWGDPFLVWSWTRWCVIREHGRQGRWTPRPSVRARTPEAVVEALLRLDPAIRDGAAHRHPRRAQELASAPPQPVPVEAQVFPTELNLVFLYIPSRSNEYLIRIVARNNHTLQILY